MKRRKHNLEVYQPKHINLTYKLGSERQLHTLVTINTFRFDFSEKRKSHFGKILIFVVAAAAVGR